jgi:hypothetical protein
MKMECLFSENGKLPAEPGRGGGKTPLTWQMAVDSRSGPAYLGNLRKRFLQP